MRGVLVIVVTLLIGLAGVYGVYQWLSQRDIKNWQTQVAPGAMPAATPEEKDKKEESRTRTEKAHIRTASLARTSGDKVIDQLLSQQPVGSSVVDVKVTPPFPRSKDLPAGMLRSKIKELYGEPAVRLASSRKGKLSERYYYVNGDKTLVTVANIEDGAVASSVSASQ